MPWGGGERAGVVGAQFVRGRGAGRRCGVRGGAGETRAKGKSVRVSQFVRVLLGRQGPKASLLRCHSL